MTTLARSALVLVPLLGSVLPIPSWSQEPLAQQATAKGPHVSAATRPSIAPATDLVQVAFEPDDAVPRPLRAQVIAGDRGDVVVAEATGNPHYLGFAAGPYYPPTEEPFDPALLDMRHAFPKQGRPTDETYVFVMFDQLMTEERIARIERMGARYLGFHPYHCGKFAVRPELVPTIAQDPDVRWVGPSRTWQKVHPDLAATLAKAQPGDALELYVSLFETDMSEQATFTVPGDGKWHVAGPGQAPSEGTTSHSAKLWMSHGWQQRALEQHGVTVEYYLPSVHTFCVRIAPERVTEITQLDFVQFVERVHPVIPHHDESTPMIHADATRGTYGGSNSNATCLGVIDTGFFTAHEMLDHVYTLGVDITSAANPYADPGFHGTHVSGTMFGLPPAANEGYRGVAPFMGGTPSNRIRLVRFFDDLGNAWGPLSLLYSIMEGDYDDGSGNVSAAPVAINCSWGTEVTTGAFLGTETDARTLDDEVWNFQQLYVFSAGNQGSATGTVGLPAVAKNAFTVGNVLDSYDGLLGDAGTLYTTSSRGPTGDGRWKPNVVAPGRFITSASSNNTVGYYANWGTSMAAPHVTALAGTLVDHRSNYAYQPHRLASILMATASTKDDVGLVTPGDAHLQEYGTGRVNALRAHEQDGGDWYWQSWQFNQNTAYWQVDFTVDPGTTRLIVCMTYHEPSASSGASQALVKDIDLWIDAEPFASGGASGDYFAHQSSIDNTEIRTIENPTAGNWRWKTFPKTSTGTANVGVTVLHVRSDHSPDLAVALTQDKRYVQPDEHVSLTATVSASDYIASAVYVDSNIDGTVHTATTTLEDGVVTNLLWNLALGKDVTLGDVRDGTPRAVDWELSWSTEGRRAIDVEARSDNATNTTERAIVVVDGTEPTLVSNLQMSHVAGVWSNDPHLSYQWDAASDALSGVAGYSIVTTSNSTVVPDETLDLPGGATSYSETLVSGSSGRTFKIRTIDRSGNVTSTHAEVGPILIDTVEPTPATNLQSPTHTVGAWSNQRTVDFTWDAAQDTISGLAGYSVNIGSAAVVPNTTIDFGDVTTHSHTFTTHTVGWYLSLRSIDNAGNGNSALVSIGPFYFDDLAPGSVGNLTSTTHTLSAWSSQPTVTMSWSAANDLHSGIAGYITGFDHSSSTTPNGTANLGNVLEETATLATSVQPYYFHIRAVDQAGNLGTTMHWGPFSVDATAPTGVTLVIDGGNPETASSGVTLDVTAVDNQSGLGEMRFRNDGGAWSPWEAFATTRNWSLFANGGSTQTGTRHVELEVRNTVGLVRATSDAIYYYAPVQYFGTACSGTLGMPSFAIQGVPGVGHTLTFDVGNTDAPLMAIYIGLSNTSWQGLPLPFDISFTGSPGCFVNVSPDLVFLSGAPGSYPIAIPNDASLAGSTSFFQPVLLGDSSGQFLVTGQGAEVTLSGS